MSVVDERPVDGRSGATGPLLRLEGVRKSFGDNLVLDGIDLEVAPGEVLVIIGPSGSGKSTLLRCVNLLEPIQSGRIVFEGEEITGKGVDVSGVRQRIGIVFQQFNLFPHLTVIDNLTLAARRIRKLPRAEAEAARARAARRWWGSRRRPTSTRTSSPAASSSVSRSRAR